MQDEEDLARFIEQQRAKIAHDRDVLKNNPSSAITDNTVNREILNRGKENRVPGGQTNRSDVATTHNPLPIQTAVRPPSTPRIFRLGDDYKKKREKLKEELRADYRNAMADKNIRTTGRRYPDQQTQLPLGGRTNSDLGLSLPIKDRLSAKERLRLERNHEYNEFKHHKEEVEEESKRRARSLSHSPVRNNVPFATPVTKIFAPPNSTIPNKKTIVIPNEPVKGSTNETYEELLERKRKQERSYRGVEDDRDDYRDKYYDDDRDEDGGYHSQRRVRFPSKNRRSQPRGHRSRRDDDFIEDDDDFRYRSRNKRRGRGRRRGRDRSSEEESDDTSEEERLFRRRKNLSLERRKAAPSFEREATTGSLRDNKDKQEFNDLRSKSAPPEQEFTGLQIGKITSANTAQRKKEEYRTDLLRQMEEKKLSKKRQREQDLHFDATVVDASGPIPRSMQAKDTSPPKRHAEVSPPPQDADKKQRKKGKKSLRYKLETSSDDEEDDRPRKGLYRGMPRQPYFAAPPPQPPMGYYPSQYPSPYNDAYYYYGTQNPLDPSGIPPPPPPGTGYPGVSPLMAALGPQRGERSNTPERARKSTEVPTARKSFQRNESSLVADDKRDELKKKQQIQEYQDELKIQIAQKEREKKAARQEQERYDLKIEEEARNYNPWGKGGGGAPMKDRQGNLITDLREMHIENEEAIRDPTKAEEVVRERLPQTNLYRREDRPVIDLSPRKDGTEGDDVLSPRFGRSNPFENRQSDEQKQQRDVYKDYLQKQIEEKKKIEAEKKEKERIEEEKEERRLEEQRQKIKAELDAEIEKDRNKKEMARRQNEDLRIQAEERKREEQRRKMEEEDELRIRKERELDERLHRQTNSPPIPTLQAQQPERQVVISPRPQPVEQARISFDDDNLTARHPPPQTQPVVRTPQIRTYRGESPIQQERRPNVQSRAESKRISRELSALRKQLLSEQRRVENQLRTVDLTGPQQPQSRKINTEYLVDLSRAKQKPVSVRRPPTVEKERPSSRALREFTDYKYRPDDTQSIRMFRAEYPETPDDAKALERQQEALIARQGRNLEDLRQQKDGRQPKNRRSEPNRSLIPPSVAQSRASLLEAETTYIPILPDDEEDQDNRYHFNSAQSSPPLSRQSRQPSARDRRRMARKPPSAQSERQVPPRNRPDNYSLNSLSSLATLDVDRLANKNHDRLEKLKAIQGDEVSLTDPDDILDRFVNKQKGGRRRPTTNEDEYGRRAGPSSYNDPLVSHSFNTRPPSVNTVDTEPWLRPETGPTMA